MGNLINISEFREASVKASLKYFFNELRSIKIGDGVTIVDKKMFFRKSQGRFIRLCRKREELSVLDLAVKANLPLADLKGVESFKKDIEDEVFFRICKVLNVSNELSVFFELVEEALNPKVKQSRKEHADVLRSYGFTFADEKNLSAGVIIPFKK